MVSSQLVPIKIKHILLVDVLKTLKEVLLKEVLLFQDTTKKRVGGRAVQGGIKDRQFLFLVKLGAEQMRESV